MLFRSPVKVLRHARVTAQDTVAVFGAGGGLGIHMVMLARWAHCRVIAVDIAADKFGACRAAGADEVVDARWVFFDDLGMYDIDAALQAGARAVRLVVE